MHAELGQTHDISHESVVLKMGEVTADKAKDKWNEMRGQAARQMGPLDVARVVSELTNRTRPERVARYQSEEAMI